MVKAAMTAGLVLKDGNMPFVTRPITVRSETNDGLTTLSFADDVGGVMIQIPLQAEVKKLIKDAVTDRRPKK